MSHVDKQFNEEDAVFEREMEQTRPLNLGSCPSELGKWLGIKNGRFFGASKYVRTAFLAKKKTQARTPDEVVRRRSQMPPAFKYGIDHESEAISAYCSFMYPNRVNLVVAASAVPFKKWGGPVNSGGLGSHFFGAAPDALIGTDGLLEVKCPYSLRDDPDQRVHLKDEWLLQALGQLEVWDRKWCDVMVWHFEFIWIWRVFRDKLEYHTDWVVQCNKRDKNGEIVTATTNHGTKTFMQVAWDEIKKFDPDYDGELGSDFATIHRMNCEFKAMRAHCVYQMDTCGAWELEDRSLQMRLDRTDPGCGHGTVDRFSNPMAGHSPALRQIWLNVRWTDASMTEYWLPSCCPKPTPPPRGGFIRSQYYTYVHGSAFTNTDLAARGEIDVDERGATAFYSD